MPVDADILHIVWGETSLLSPRDKQDATSAHLQNVVAKLAKAARDRGIDEGLRRALPPRVGAPDEARYQDLKTTVGTGLGDVQALAGLPMRAALWEVTPSDPPRIVRPLPKGISWITDDDVMHGAAFVVGDGSDNRVYGLFESPKAPVDGASPWVSVVTGTGLPRSADPKPMGLAWTLGILGVVAFVIGGVFSAWCGDSLSRSKASLTTASPRYERLLIEQMAAVCKNDAQASPIAPATAKVSVADAKSVCELTLSPVKSAEDTPARYPQDEVDKVFALMKGCQSAKTPDPAVCGPIYRAAVEVDQAQTWRRSFFKWFRDASDYLTGPTSTTRTASILVPLLTTTAGLALLLAGLGLGTKGRVTGVWIDQRNRVSLARAQVTLWTVVALAGYLTLLMFNIGLATTPDTGVFPTLPGAIAAALGIATTSPMLSALILRTKVKDKDGNDADITVANADDDLAKRGVPFLGNASTGLHTRPSAAGASMADIFMGEENADAKLVDVSRLQNVVLTISLVLAYLSTLVGLTSGLDPATAAPFVSLPDPGETFAALLLVSHATYLVAKAHDSTRPPSSVAQQ